MRIILAAIVVTLVRAGAVDSSETRNERSINDDGFEEKLRKGYSALKSEPNEDDTVRFLRKLHSMEGEIREKLTMPSAQSDDSLDVMKSYGQVEMEHIKPMNDTIEEINKKNKVDMALFQGDMILTREQAEEIMDDVRESLGHRRKRQAFRDKNYPKNLWSRGIAYAFWNASNDAREAFKKAALLWTHNTCVHIAESQTATDRINVIKGGGCWSYVGRLGGVQSLSLGEGCETVGTAAHEIGHALGLFHTQSRHDRDDFITLHMENIYDGWATQFVKQTEHTNYNYNLTYDYGSIMHYGARSVTKNDKPVMVPVDVKYTETLGSREISFYDKLMINMHYGCLDRCKDNSAACENGGFPHPRDCSRCICPTGYEGKLCNERPSGCGKKLTATSSFQTLEDKLPQNTRIGKTDGFSMCNYWLEAPAGSTIEVVIDNLTEGLGYDGCSYGGVEIKTGSDKRRTGYKFCSKKSLGTSLVSTHNIVPIITYGKSQGFTTVLRYRIASSGPGTSNSTSKPTAPPDSRSTSPPNTCCQDNHVCATLMNWDFCRSPKYDEKIRKLICPKSCGYC